ncbi:unnamed protein product [Schistosoma mattheei]|uniref:Uncharacterized protein n=1 Tax=Schistosoma mattheei TaxID=31246 RepID=A0A183PA17_9TREM|nr:unnamed protein product [Schistosoma mattheei]
MVVGGSQQETLDPGFVLFGTHQQGVPVILRELVLPGGFDLVSPSFTVRDVTTELSGPRLTSCRTDVITIDWSLVDDQCHACLVLISADRMLDWWPHCNMVDRILSALNKD